MNEFKIKKGLIVHGSGSTILDIQGSLGQLFSVEDSFSGSLFSVNNISGIPIMEVFSNDFINLGTFGSEAIKILGNFANITGSLFGNATSTSAVAGTTDFVSKFTSGTTIGNSQIFDDGINVGINTINPATTLEVNGDISTIFQNFHVSNGGRTLNVGGTDMGNVTSDYTLFEGATSILSNTVLNTSELKVQGTILFEARTEVACSAGQLMSLSAATEKWILADADDASATKILGVALNTVAIAGDVALLLEGTIVTEQFNGTIKVGSVLYASTTAGDFSFDPPTSPGDYVRGVGWCLKSSSATDITVFFQPDCTWLEL